MMMTARDHALLFATISKSVIQEIGVTKAEPLIRQAVREYGKYFCREIDEALVHGFNPDLVLQVNSTRTNGGEVCDFVFRDAGLTFFKFLGLAFKKKVRPGKAAVMPWEYHCGHLYKTMGRVVRRELGEKADIIMENALKESKAFFDDKQMSTIKAYQATDFEILP
jgi:hypothetical protein